LKNQDKYIESLIAGGENQHLDFKYNISDSRKIAKTLVAFANTGGGKLLIGVRDNGSIAGIISDEELFMIEAAAQMYSKPEIEFEIQQWQMLNKVILEISVKESHNKPHYAQNEEGKWLAYVRHKDQNILANLVMLEVWTRQYRKKGIYIRYKKEEEILLHYLESNQFIALNQFCRLAKTSRFKAVRTLVNLIALDILKINIDEKGFTYSMK
jgi:predicted HTH transcriptional regulator